MKLRGSQGESFDCRYVKTGEEHDFRRVRRAGGVLGERYLAINRIVSLN